MKREIEQTLINESCEEAIMQLLKDRVKVVRKKLKNHDKFMSEIKRNKKYLEETVKLITEQIKLQKEIDDFEAKINDQIKFMKCKYLQQLCFFQEDQNLRQSLQE